MTVKDYVETFNALLTPLIAILAAYIAWQQYQVNNSSLRNELYERRIRVFRAFMSYLADVMREGRASYQRVAQFYAETSEAIFLFDKRVTSKVEELYHNGLKLTDLHEQLYPFDGSPGLPVGAERSRVTCEQTELLKWFGDEIKNVRELFKCQMKIK
jgi:hypothetical protein